MSMTKFLSSVIKTASSIVCPPICTVARHKRFVMERNVQKNFHSKWTELFRSEI